MTPAEARKSARDQMEAMDKLYQNHDGIGERYEAKLKAMHKPHVDTEEPSLADQVTKIVQRYQVYVLARWGRGEIEGIETERSVLLRASRTETLAKAQELRGNVKTANRMRRQAEKLREHAKTLRPADG